MHLETYTPAELAAEQERKRQKDELARLSGARLFGMPIDTTGDLFDARDAAFPLFTTVYRRAAS